MKLNVTREKRGVDPTASFGVIVINLCVTETLLIRNSVCDSAVNVAVLCFHQSGGFIVSPVPDWKSFP